MAKQLFLIQLTYLKAPDEIDNLMNDHVAYLKKYYKKKQFIVSGRQVPRKGGIILCYAKTLKEVKAIIEEDPFKTHAAAKFRIVPFLASMHSEEFGIVLDALRP